LFYLTTKATIHMGLQIWSKAQNWINKKNSKRIKPSYNY